MLRVNPHALNESDDDFPRDEDVPVNPATKENPKVIMSTEDLIAALNKAPTMTRRVIVNGLTIEMSAPIAPNVTVATHGVRIVPRRQETNATELLNAQRTREGLAGQRSENSRESAPEITSYSGPK